ncbi:30S ribosomal protein S16 [Candidatus Parcubacteria bacterium]|nr:30S ribosomal protein S16 [Candidatus Parcubacteria bacterium]
MLTIRFFRTGKKHQPFFKIVVTDKRKPPKSGRFVEEVGFYNPLTKEKNLKAQRVKYWLAKGAQPSDTIHNLLVSEKIVAGKKIALHKKPKKKEEKKEKPAEVKPKEEKPTEEKPTEKKEPVPAMLDKKTKQE